MTPNGTTLTELKVWKMINDAIKEYDGINTRRHEEHTKKLDKLTYLILGTLLTAAAGLVVDIAIHSMGK